MHKTHIFKIKHQTVIKKTAGLKSLLVVLSLICNAWAGPKTISFVDGTYDLDHDGLSELLLITHDDEAGAVLEFVEIDKLQQHHTLWSFSPAVDNRAKFTDVKLIDLDDDGIPELIGTLQHSFNGSEFTQPWLFIFRWTGETFTTIPTVVNDARLAGKFVRPGNLSFWNPGADSRGWITISMGSPLRSILLLELNTTVFPWELTGRDLLQPLLFKNGYGRVYAVAFTVNQKKLLSVFSPEGSRFNAVVYDFNRRPAEVASAVLTVEGAKQLLSPDLKAIDLDLDGNEEILLPFSNGLVMQLRYEENELQVASVNMDGKKLFMLPDPATDEDINNLVVTRVEQGLYSTIVDEPVVEEIPAIAAPEPLAPQQVLPAGIVIVDTLEIGQPYQNPVLKDTLVDFYSFQWLQTPPEGCVFDPDINQISWTPTAAQLGGHLLTYKLEFRLGEKVIRIADGGNFRHQTVPILAEEIMEYGILVVDSAAAADDVFYARDEGLQFYSVAALIPERPNDNRFVFEGVPPFGLATMEFAQDAVSPSLMHSISADLSHITSDKKISFSYSSSTPPPRTRTTFRVIHDIDNSLMTLAFIPPIEQVHQSLRPEDLFTELYQLPEYFFSGFPQTTGIDLLGDKLQFSISDADLNRDAQLSFVGITSPTSPAHLLTMYFDKGELQAVRGEVKIQPTGSKKVITEFDFTGDFRPVRISTQLRLPGTLAVPGSETRSVEPAKPVNLAFEPPPPRSKTRREVNAVERGSENHALHFSPGQYVKIYSAPGFDFSQGEMTVEGYLKLDGVVNSEALISKQNDFEVNMSAAGVLQFQTGRIDDKPVILTGNIPVPADVWVHFAAVQDSNGMRLYQDGKLIGENNQSGSINYSSSSLLFGSRDFFNGALDEIRISAMARYVTNTFKPAERFAADDATVGLWHFDRGTGLLVIDASGWDISGEIFGARWVSRTEAVVESE